MTRTLVNQVILHLEGETYASTLYRPAYRRVEDFAEAVAHEVQQRILKHYEQLEENHGNEEG